MPRRPAGGYDAKRAVRLPVRQYIDAAETIERLWAEWAEWARLGLGQGREARQILARIGTLKALLEAADCQAEKIVARRAARRAGRAGERGD